ncbi:hypothetical protein [Salinimicrobium sp. TH3]|uniref:hypothetical protein n=1 Tax=Salinimicrobium sp. TH3 TaxID=2997342 RepID=UPI002273E283|nr:hypothetical protein [Salinimicrobium sp. TH3]MCY2688589.1 hypothetical protein [Salinimicrobium sp. TH3]
MIKNYLRKVLVLLILITWCNTAHPQSESNHAIYIGNDINAGNYLGLDFNVNYAYLEKYSLRLGYSWNVRKAETQPYDYSAGFFKTMLLGLGSPADQLGNLQLAAGRIYKLNNKGTIRANLSLGLGYTTIKEPGNWQRTGSHLLKENYTWDYDKYHTISLIINPKIEFPLTRFFGLSVSPMVQLNKDRVYLGIGVGHIFGLLRDRYEPAQDGNY